MTNNKHDKDITEIQEIQKMTNLKIAANTKAIGEISKLMKQGTEEHNKEMKEIKEEHNREMKEIRIAFKKLLDRLTV